MTSIFPTKSLCSYMQKESAGQIASTLCDGCDATFVSGAAAAIPVVDHRTVSIMLASMAERVRTADIFRHSPSLIWWCGDSDDWHCGNSCRLRTQRCQPWMISSLVNGVLCASSCPEPGRAWPPVLDLSDAAADRSWIGQQIRLAVATVHCGAVHLRVSPIGGAGLVALRT